MKQITDAMIDLHFKDRDPAYWDDDEQCEECGSTNIEWDENEDGTWDYTCLDCKVDTPPVEEADLTHLAGKRLEFRHEGEWKWGDVVEIRDNCYLRIKLDNGKDVWVHIWMCNQSTAK